MDVQYLIAALIIAVAGIFAVRAGVKRARSFSAKKDCGADCGCGDKNT